MPRAWKACARGGGDLPEYELHLWRRNVTVAFDPQKRTAKVGDQEYKLETTRYGNRVIVELDGKPYGIEIVQGRVYVNGEEQRFTIQKGRPAFMAKAAAAKAAQGAKIKPPIPGRIVEVQVKVGDAVKRGQALLTLEAMKMQNEVSSPADGKVKAVHCKPGDNVDGNAVLIEIE